MLTVRQVSKTFRQGGPTGGVVKALEDINLTVEKGEFVSLIGPSGCGKSTLLNLVGGLMEDYEGSITLQGSPIRGPHPSTGMVFQEDSTFPWLTSLQNVTFGLRMRKEPRNTAHEKGMGMLEQLGLAEFADAYPSQLSGGMRQRVAIGRALVLEPEILLMDEPFGALDEQTRIVLGEQLLEIQEKLQQTVVFVTHNLGEAIQLSNRVVVMSARPARIREVIDIDLGGQRGSQAIGNAAYGEYQGRLWSLLREEYFARFGVDNGPTYQREIS